MHQRTVGEITFDGLPAVEDLEARGRQIAEHQHQRRLVEILDTADQHADPDIACPLHAWPALLQFVQQRVGLLGQPVAEVDQAQRGVEHGLACRALGVDLRRRKCQRHVGVRMGGVGSDEALHGQVARRGRRSGWAGGQPALRPLVLAAGWAGLRLLGAGLTPARSCAAEAARWAAAMGIEAAFFSA